ncbi:MAG: nickel ABC transporter permease subunit NikB [Termitinemataceae bacterium]|nr:MAG: nickel ABC transporter permease subunit NikB [Termitinemataceae bacterium]
MCAVFFCVTALVFCLLRLAPGDAAYIRLKDRGIDLTSSALAAARAELGLDKPIIKQYFLYLNSVLHFDFGVSITNNENITSGIERHFKTTLLIAIPSFLFILIVAFPIGILSALHQKKLFDNASRLVSLVFMSIPSFCLALTAILIFSVRLKWLPSFGISGSSTTEICRHLVMPCLVLGSSGGAYYGRFIRSAILEELSSEYVRAAMLRGIDCKTILIFGVLRNASIPIVSSLGMSFAMLLGGQAVIEKVFSIPGLGRYLIDALLQRDYPVALGCVILYVFLFTIINLLCDIICIILDPKIRRSIQI